MHERRLAAAGRSGRPRGAPLALAGLLVFALTAAAQPVLRCTLKAPSQVAAGAPVLLRFTVTNAGSVPLQLLEWNTPFEGWFAPFVQVSRDGVPLAYKGPSIKRGDPGAEEYFRLAAGRSRTARVDLSEPYDLSLPGRYRVQPQISLFDVVSSGTPVPRKRGEMVSRPLDCNAVEISVTAPRR